MNERQKRFCEFYVGECIGNVVQSALKAGYSNSYANHLAYKLLENIEIQDYIKELSKDGENKRISTAEDVQRFWTSVMNDVNEQMKNRLRASELLAKTQGLFNNDW
jgi:phage terminase small subunit